MFEICLKNEWRLASSFSSSQSVTWWMFICRTQCFSNAIINWLYPVGPFFSTTLLHLTLLKAVYPIVLFYPVGQFLCSSLYNFVYPVCSSGSFYSVWSFCFIALVHLNRLEAVYSTSSFSPVGLYSSITPIHFTPLVHFFIWKHL